MHARLTRSAPDPAPAAAILLLVLLVWQARAASAGAADGLALALELAIPSLFPFFVLSGLVRMTGAADRLGQAAAPLMTRLFRLPGAAAAPLVLGLVGGYPLGAHTAACLVRDGRLTPAEGARLLTFCNNTGPAFLIGVCGAGLRGSTADGIALYLIHILSAGLTGLLLCRPGAPVPSRAPALSRPDPRPFAACLTESVADAALSCGKITAFIMIFSSLRAVLTETGGFAALSALSAPLARLLAAPAAAGSAIAAGLLEMTAGLALLPEAAGAAALPAMSMLTAFGGLSVWCQTLSVLSGSGLPLSPMARGKLVHAALAAGLTLIWQALPL